MKPCCHIPNPPVSRQALFKFLDDLGITHTSIDHEPVFTVEDSSAIKANMPGGHSKNLFLKDKKGHLVLISALHDTQIALNQLHKKLGTARFSFGKADLLEEKLGVKPGSVTAFALINDREREVRFILDAALMAYDQVNFHPLKNDATTRLSSEDLLKFIRALGREPDIMDFSAEFDDLNRTQQSAT